MKDVAAVAGVSLKTVSRVVNEEPSVLDDTAERVRHAVELLDYRHNSAARTLARGDGRTGSIGLLLDDIGNPFSALLYRAIEDTCAERDTIVLAGSSDKNQSREAILLAEFDQRRVDGVIIVPVGEGTGLHSHVRYGTSVVCLDRPGSVAGADSVTTNNREASYEAVREMIELGHERIAFLGDLDGIWTEQERFAGYLDALRQGGVTVPQDLIVRGRYDSSMSEEETHRLLDLSSPPTAIFAWQNRATIGAWRALRSRGVNTMTALIGFDDFELADLLEPPLTVIAQDVAGLGATAAALLLDRLDGAAGPPHHVVLPSRLIRRESGRIPPPSG